MRGSLGEKIGEGATADVHAWAPGQVVKLFKAGASPRLGRHEARMTRAVFAAGGPAPEVLGEVTRGGALRHRAAAPRRTDPAAAAAGLATMTYEASRRSILAALYISVHRTTPPPEVASLRDWMDATRRGLGRLAPGGHRHWRPHPDRSPAAGGRAVPCRPSPRQRDHDGGWPENHRLGLPRSVRRSPSTLAAAT
jgi:hypothetical protein